jgi:hydrogenase maturation protease
VRYLIGIGTYLGRDDSVGLRVVERVVEADLDRGFRAIDMAGNLLDLIHYLDDSTEKVLIVDCARMGIEPGEFTFFSADEARSVKGEHRFSAHEGDLLKVLEFARAVRGAALPPVTIMGIEPLELREGDGLSAVLAGRLDEYASTAVGFVSAR